MHTTRDSVNKMEEDNEYHDRKNHGGGQGRPATCDTHFRGRLQSSIGNPVEPKINEKREGTQSPQSVPMGKFAGLSGTGPVNVENNVFRDRRNDENEHGRNGQGCNSMLR